MTIDENTPLTLSREDLYELAWSKPMRELAKDFGISDVALAKRSRRLVVPVPGRWYWARVDAGQKPYRPQLAKKEPHRFDEGALTAGTADQSITTRAFDFWKDVWSPFAQIVVDEDLERSLIVKVPEGSTSIHIDADNKLARALAQLPVLGVYFDSGPEDVGPGSGNGYVICLADDASTDDVKLTIAALADSIRSDGDSEPDWQLTTTRGHDVLGLKDIARMADLL